MMGGGAMGGGPMMGDGPMGQGPMGSRLGGTPANRPSATPLSSDAKAALLRALDEEYRAEALYASIGASKIGARAPFLPVLIFAATAISGGDERAFLTLQPSAALKTATRYFSGKVSGRMSQLEFEWVQALQTMGPPGGLL